MMPRAGVSLSYFICPSLVAGLMGQIGCARLSDYDRIGVAVTVIRDGDGYRKAFGSDKDFFTIHLEALEHPTQRLRNCAVIDVPTHAVMPATYGRLLDAYIGYGPIDKLAEVLLRAWGRAQPGTEERWRMGNAFLELKARRYLWAHPQVAKDLGVKREKPPYKGYGHAGRGLFTKYLLAEGDEEFREVWLDYQEHQKLLLEGRLEPVRWWEKPAAQ